LGRYQLLKISAVGQVLQAAGSRGASDPAAVLQNVRKQQMDKLKRAVPDCAVAGSAARSCAGASIEKYSQLLSDNDAPHLKVSRLKNAPRRLAKLRSAKSKYEKLGAMQTVRHGTSIQTEPIKLLNWSLPANTKYQNLGDRLVLVDEDTGKPVLDESGKERTLKVNMSPAEAANYGLAVKRENRIAAGGGEGGGGGGTSYRFITTADGIVAVDPKNPTRQIKTGLKSPTSGYTPTPPPNPAGNKKY